MCGISVLISVDGTPVPDEEIRKMTDLVKHRGPDGSGYYTGPGFAMGHRRLAIIDLSDLGRQPMQYIDRHVITFNGEIYNYVELKKELSGFGYVFRTHTDTEVICAAYDKWGDDCLNHFNGMWAFAIYDIQRRRFFCARDRFGVKPFYFAKIGGKYAFASEIKQFTAIKGWRASLNKTRAYDFLIKGLFDHTNETLFETVYQLPGGFSLVYELSSNSCTVNKWYDLTRRVSDSVIEGITLDDAKNHVKKLLFDSVMLRLRADVRVGSCLSGGMDSSSIVCIANQILRTSGAQENQQTVSSCFKEHASYDEQHYINMVVEKTGVGSYRIFPSVEDLIHVFDRLTWHQDEPFTTTSMFAQWSVFEEARKQGIIVMLDGQGADETLAGYDGYFNVFFTSLLKKFRLGLLAREWWLSVRNHALQLPESVRYLLRSGADAFFRHYRVWNVPEWLTLPSAADGIAIDSRSENVFELSIDQVSRSNLPMLLKYEDRNSMAHSVESRVPFLDYRLVEHLISLPDTYKIHGGKRKFVLREAMRGTVPDPILDRNDKKGFVTPEPIWVRQNSRWFLNKIRESVESTNGLVNVKAVHMLEQIIQGKRPFEFTPWRLISFGRWMNVFSVKS
jgi:asparagine synthase (glutamine-hydrolysing)